MSLKSDNDDSTVLRPYHRAEAGALAGTVLVLDEERSARRSLRMMLEDEGARVVEAATYEAALTTLEAARVGADAAPVDAVVAALELSRGSGLRLVEACHGWADRSAAPPVILVSERTTLSEAARATRLGAFDFLEKPPARERLAISVRNALQHRHVQGELRERRTRVRRELIGESRAMLELLHQISRVAATRARVLIEGESGTGKELVARAIHEASDRRGGPFIKINCAAIPRELIESELFGHTRGAFTGAAGPKRGLFELADGGTLLLDEIGDMDLGAQAKVLRALQSGEITRVGDERPVRVDVRVLASTHRNLREQTQRGEFREDLYFRLAVVPLVVPPLRERHGDVARLCRHSLALACSENGIAPKRLTAAAQAALDAYAWPGNVRELRNVLERAAILSTGDIDLADLPPELVAPRAAPDLPGELVLPLRGTVPAGVSLRTFRESQERAFILQRLAEHGGNVARTADALGLERTHLYRKLRSYEVARRG
jgi:DNA-binding NtrC family response regulator